MLVVYLANILVYFLQFLAGVEIIGPCRAGKAVILSYYPCGSLLQYLTTNVLTWRTMYNLVFSLANGVAYIHGEIDEYGKR